MSRRIPLIHNFIKSPRKLPGVAEMEWDPCRNWTLNRELGAKDSHTSTRSGGIIPLLIRRGSLFFLWDCYFWEYDERELKRTRSSERNNLLTRSFLLLFKVSIAICSNKARDENNEILENRENVRGVICSHEPRSSWWNRRNLGATKSEFDIAKKDPTHCDPSPFWETKGEPGIGLAKTGQFESRKKRKRF